MRAILLFIVAVATVNGENYILGGQEAEPFSIPYIASLQLHLPPNFVHVCGGVILTPRWILTAGDCLDGLARTEVLTGKHDLMIFETGQQRVGVVNAASASSLDGKVALIYLATPLRFDERTRNIGMSEIMQGAPGEDAMFVGWPFRHPVVQNETRSQPLLRSNFRIISHEQCSSSATRDIDDVSEFCTVPSDDQLVGQIAACNGNIGSPLYQLKGNRNVVIGILTEFPNPCNATNQPNGIFARLSNYQRWITRMIEQPDM